MNTDTCQTIEEWLVDFADGALPSDQAARVQAHLAQCPTCRATIEALQQSLAIAQTIWQDTARDVGQSQPRRLSLWHYGAVAAAILLALGTLFYRPDGRTHPAAPGPSLADIERQMVEAASAARLLVATEQMETQPALRDIAKSQYRHIVERYPDTAAAERGATETTSPQIRRIEP